MAPESQSILSDRQEEDQREFIFIVVMAGISTLSSFIYDSSLTLQGVCGTGKSTLGLSLSRTLDFPYVEGDELHPKSNVDKMSAGVPLTDEDREPWLGLIRRTAEEMTVGRGEERGGVVISCSALKKCYREILRGKTEPVDNTFSSSPSPSPRLKTYFVFINGPRSVLQHRMETRPGHFMKASMLDSQLSTLESPVGEERVVEVSLEDETGLQVERAVEGLRRMGVGM
ncbi:hypothetical protein AX17_004117 [Amanita inopinata Kibby_2008]|nr:hypothetical protein AX17_004117 [Amanita inopinata Kibby_2008]